MQRFERAHNAQPGRNSTERAFWAQRTGPLIEAQPDGSRLVTFLWRDDDAAGVLVGVNRVTNSLAQSRMHRIAGSATWYLTLRLQPSWRATYNFLPLDEAGLSDLHNVEPRWVMHAIRGEGVLDPTNPVSVVTHGGRASVVSLDQAAPSAPGVWAATPSSAPIERRTPSGRRVWLYLPLGARLSPSTPLVVCLDGDTWLRSGDLFRAIDAVMTEKREDSPMLALIDAGETRQADLGADGGMSEEIAAEIVPWLRASFGIAGGPALVTVTGESLGGLTAVRAGLEQSAVVGNVLAQSPSLWQVDLTAGLSRVESGRMRLTAGSREATLVGPVRAFASVAEHAGLDLDYAEYDGGHDVAWWREHWLDGMRSLLAE